MIKFKTALIAAAALVSAAAPSVASAGKLADALQYFRAQKDAIHAQRNELRDLFNSGNSGLTRAEFRAQMQQYAAQVDETEDTLDELRASR